MNNMGYKVAIALLLLVIGMMWYWDSNTEDALETAQNAPTAEDGYSKAMDEIREADLGEWFIGSYEPADGDPLTEGQTVDVEAAIDKAIDRYTENARPDF